MLTSVDDTERVAGLIQVAGEHARALAQISARTAAGLLVITDGLQIGHFPAVQRSVQRERRRADLFRGLERDLRLVAQSAPGASRGAPPRLDAIGERTPTGSSGWLALIALRQWNIRHYWYSRNALSTVADELVPLLRARADLHAQTAASRLPECLATTRFASCR